MLDLKEMPKIGKYVMKSFWTIVHCTLGVLDNNILYFELGRPCTLLLAYLLFVCQDPVAGVFAQHNATISHDIQIHMFKM